MSIRRTWPIMLLLFILLTISTVTAHAQTTDAGLAKETIPKQGQSYSEQHVYHFMGGDSFQQMQQKGCSSSSSGQR